MRPFIAVVDNEPAIRAYVRLVLEGSGFLVAEYPSGRAFLDRYEPQAGCIVLEINLPSMDGLEVLVQMQRRYWKVPTIVMSGAYPIGIGPALRGMGVITMLQKPFDPGTILDWVERGVAIDLWQRRERSFVH